MPPYYAHRMASENHQPLLVYSTADGKLDVTATRSEDGSQLVLHVVNTSGSQVVASLEIDGFGQIAEARSITLSGELTAANTPENPEGIIPQEKEILHAESQECTIPPYSYTIYKFTRK